MISKFTYHITQLSYHAHIVCYPEVLSNVLLACFSN